VKVPSSGTGTATWHSLQLGCGEASLGISVYCSRPMPLGTPHSALRIPHLARFPQVNDVVPLASRRPVPDWLRNAPFRVCLVFVGSFGAMRVWAGVESAHRC
jgi:hypothetical protein